MKTLKALLEDVRAFNLDTDEELDLDALADLDLDSLLGGEYQDDDGSDVVGGLDFSDLANLVLDDEPFEFGDKSLELSDLGDDAIGDGGGYELGGGEEGVNPLMILLLTLGGDVITIKTLAETIIRINKSHSKIVYENNNKSIGYNMDVLDSEKSNKILKWKPAVNIESGIERISEYYKKQLAHL
jgi:hypothetical protein